METSPFQDENVGTHGCAVRFLASAMKPTCADWRIAATWPGWWARGGEARFGDLLEMTANLEEGT
jgi:hypothetical protein